MAEREVNRLDLEEKIKWLRQYGKDDEIPLVQLKLDRMHSHDVGVSSVEDLKNGNKKTIVWPSVHPELFGYCLDRQVENIFRAKTFACWSEKFTYEPSDELEFLDVLSHKIQALELDKEDSGVGDLVYAYSWDGDKCVYWKWDERENDFLMPLKTAPLIWRECDEREMRGVLRIQRWFDRSQDAIYRYVFSLMVTKKLGSRVLEDLVVATKQGIHREFIKYILSPLMLKNGWDFANNAGLIVRNMNCRDYGTQGWNSETSAFDGKCGYCDFEMERWLGWVDGLPPKDDGVDPVWLPETVAHLIMKAFSDPDFAAIKTGPVKTEEIRSVINKWVQYNGFVIESLCGIEFGEKSSNGKVVEKLSLKTPFRCFSTALCDYTPGLQHRYRISLMHTWLWNFDLAIEELNKVKSIFEEKFELDFVKLPRDFGIKGFEFKNGIQLVYRSPATTGILCMAAKSPFVLYAERGQYRFVLCIQERERDNRYNICVSIENGNVLSRDLDVKKFEWRKAFGALKDKDGADVL